MFSCGSSPAGGGSLVSLLRGVWVGCVVVSEDVEAGGVVVGAGGDGEGLMRWARLLARRTLWELRKASAVCRGKMIWMEESRAGRRKLPLSVEFLSHQVVRERKRK